MRRDKKYLCMVQIWLLSVMLIAGCATTNSRRGPATQTHSAQSGGTTDAAQAENPNCPSRFDRTRAAGTVGGVVGFIAASALGSPLLGILYSVGGYAIGFASADPCKKENGTVTAAVQTPNTTGPVLAGKIAEEDLR
jgi:hypothetical protein